MKKYILLVAGAIIISSCNSNTSKQASEQADSANVAVNAEEAPVIKFKQDVYDFGKIQEGQKVSFDFEFVNEGKSPLIISDASATCGCTVPEVPQEPILPGKEGKIRVVFNSTGKSGLQDKPITIRANTVPAETVVRLIGEIVK
ncbi:protein of unknown function DUF1573 [Pseudopedobacter saltans DSM 12145]|uniref:DUF1573 domain-containing protein n=1 Tax=Pseudopedobacter saltans (strain ATCC 51119 / DSM 12145 / JCM 21818 / CCUG 39354 / LMG 10337 / NBRC 100064 / NCIMB 13643) TaxID=762903 RepID=F0SAL5_PSESL|nr:DUF1573 domain-containing protein [Pseudopedobacter saltans]ADY52635.1 protein of unknown function DUF1573 [Pseudopedobacter saltans DSM 12145]